MEMMKAAVLEEARKIAIKDISVPDVKSGDMEIKVSAIGVCGSDVHMWKAGRGWYDEEIRDFRMGHEFCGVVTDPGESNYKPDDRVVFWANMYCGKCDMCRSGKEQLCREVAGKNYIGFVCNGAYSEKFVGPFRNAYLLPDEVSDKAAALIDPLMVAHHAVVQADVKLNDKVLVSGTGIIADMIAELAKKSGASYVAMLKRNDRKLDKVKEAGFVDEYFTSSEEGLGELLREKTKGGFDVAFEAVGSDSTLDSCIKAVKPGGAVAAIGNTTTDTIPFDFNYLVLNEIRLIGSVSCTEKEFRGTIDLIAKGVIDPTRYITDTVSLEGLQHVFERLTTPNESIVKAVVIP